MHVDFNPGARPSMAHHVGQTPQQLHDELLAAKVDGARHDSALCPFCRANDSAESHASVPSGDEPSGASNSDDIPTTEGGTHDMSDENKTISIETHEALLSKGIADAVKTTDAALATATTEKASLQTQLDEKTTQNTALTEDNARLNRELDEAQVKLKTATDEVAELRQTNEAAAEQARLTEIAKTRSEQVGNLNLFPAEYVTEKASEWAKLDDDAWNSRVDEWKQARPAGTAGTTTTDAASAMSGTSGELTDAASGEGKDTDKQPARRTVLGLS